MKKPITLVAALVLAIGLPFGQVAVGQDFGQLLNTVEKMEASLKSQIDTEASQRAQDISKLRQEIAQLKKSAPAAPDNGALAKLEREIVNLKKQYASLASAAPTGGADEQQWLDVWRDIEFLKAENSYLRSLLEKNTKQLASLEGGWTAPAPAEMPAHPTDQGGRLPEGFSLSGFVDASNYSDMNARESSFGLDQVEVDIVKDFNGQASLRADVEYVSDGFGNFDLDLEQGFLSYTLGSNQPWTFTFGKFNAPIGFELLDAPDMYQYSHAIVFDNGLPTNLTGLMVATEFPAVVDWCVYLVNGWDVNSDNNKEKTFGTRVGFTPMENLNFGISAISGPEQDDNVSNRRTVVDLDLTFNPLPIWTLGGEVNFGSETKVLADGSDGTWSGFLLMSNVGLGDRWGITTRFDYFHDKDGLRTGTVQEWKAFCVSPSVSIIDGLGGLVEMRYDFSDQKVWTDSNGDPNDNLFTTAVEFTYSF